jgi:hypothetical protein
MYINVCLYEYVYTPAEADVPKLSHVHMGHVRPKINDAAVVY